MRLELLTRAGRTLSCDSTVMNWLSAVSEGVDAVGVLAPVTPATSASAGDACAVFRMRPDDRLMAFPRVTGYVRVFLMTPLILIQCIRLRLFCRDVIARVPEHGNLFLLPMLRLLGFRLTLWIVANRSANEVAHKRVRRRNLKLRLGMLLSRWTGAVEAVFLRRTPVIANGSELRRDIQERLRGTSPIMPVVSTTLRSADLPPIRELRPEAPRSLRLLFVGRIAPEKGLDDLLRAAALLQQGPECVPVEVDFVGQGAHGEEGRLRHRVTELGLEGSVRFHGLVPYGPALFDHFREADLFVLPSHAEGTPRVLIEAMAFGLPIVATNVDGIPDVVCDGVNALLVPPHAPDRLAAAIRRLAQAPSTRRRMSLVNHERAAANTVEALSARMLKFIRQGVAPDESGEKRRVAC